MLTQTAIRSDAFHRSVPRTRNVALAATKVFDGASERKPLGQSIYLMGRRHNLSAQCRNLRREQAGRVPLQGDQRRGANLQDSERRSPPDRRILPAWRHFRARVRRRAHLVGRGDRRREGAGDQAQHAHRARCPRCRSCRRAFCAYWVRGAAYARARPAAHQDRAPVRPMPLCRDTR